MNNRTKLFIPSHKLLRVGFLLLTFGFVFLFTQNSFAAFINDKTEITTSINNDDVIKMCGTFDDLGYHPNNLKKNQFCLFDQSNIAKKLYVTNDWGFSPLKISITKIKAPYSIAENLWKTINTTAPSNYPNGNESGTGKIQNFSACRENAENRQTGNYCDRKTYIQYSNLAPIFTVPEIYDNVKREIIRSCLPGKIETTRPLPPSPSSVAICCKITKNTPVSTTFETSNYSSWSFSGCDLLSNSISLSINGDSDSELVRIPDEGSSLNLSWSVSSPNANCGLKGFNANDADSVEEIIEKINPEKIGIDVRAGIANKYQNQITYGDTKTGIYKYTLSCTGVLDGKNSSEIGTREIVKKVYIGDIPPDPVIDFHLVTPNANLVPAPEGASYDYSVFLNQTFELGWSVTNLDQVKNTETLPIIIKRLEKSSGNTSTLTSSKNTNSKTSPIRLPGLGNHELYLEATNPDFPGLTSKSQSIIIRVKLATTENILDIDFSADKTLIDKGDPVELSWDASDAARASIDQGIGLLTTKVGKMTVYPTSATSYTLTAKSPIVNIPDTKKIVTINVRGADITPIDIKPFEIATSTATILPEQEGKPTENKIDLKINGSDGPVTLSAPAKFALSWNLNTYCLATGSWLSIKTKAGSESMSLNKNGKYTYSLYCPGYGTDSVVVEVVNSNVNGLLNAALGTETETTRMPIAEASISTDFVNYSKDIKIIRGEPVNIYIKIDQDIDNDGKTTRDASGLWSDLISNRGYCLYNNDLIKGTPIFNGMIESPADAQSCNTKLGTFTFNDEPGTYQYGVFRILQNDQKFSNIANINIIVENPPAPTSAPVIDLKINGDDATEQILGTPTSFNVSWSVTNADTCEASGSWNGTRDLSGIQSFVSSSKKDFIYTLTCTGELGASVKSISLKVTEAPTCSFTALPPLINKQSAFITDSQLSWKCDYTDECNLSPNTTNAIIKTYGTLRVSPTQTTNYILSCTNSDVSKSFEAKVEVAQ